MSIRRNIILLTVPLFLALAMVNGALLYFQEKAEMSQAVSEQALAAAVTTAEFISSMERPAEELAEATRVKALKAAAREIPGLDGLDLIARDGTRHALISDGRQWSPETLAPPQTAHALPLQDVNGKARHVVALAPVAGGGFVAARIDAEPMFARMAAIQRAMLMIVAASGVIATLLAWFVARRIVRELDKNHAAIIAIGRSETPADEQDLTIREARDLAAAVRLMEASSRAGTERTRRVTARRDRERTVATALAATRAALFGALSDEATGVDVAARIAGDAPPGSFFALAGGGEWALLAIGRCDAETPQQAFARAVAARDFIRAGATAEAIEAARGELGIAELQMLSWTTREPLPAGTRLLALTDPANADRAEAYAERNRDAAPDALLDGIALLLGPAGVFAAVSR